MQEFLLFRLYGPFASWGDIAVGEYRPSFAHPSKSAVLGLIAAALGIRRSEEEKLKILSSAYNLGICVEASGVLLRDYHTVQSPSAKKGKTYHTRASEIIHQEHTMLTSRDYRCDALYTIALWYAAPESQFQLQELLDKLKYPVFTLYLGRKSCPLAMPLQAQIVKASNLNEAFSKAQFLDHDLVEALKEEQAKIKMIYWEGTEESGFKKEHVITRRDYPISRRRWQFAERQEYYTSVESDRED